MHTHAPFFHALLLCLNAFFLLSAAHAGNDIKPFRFVQLTDIHLSNKSAIEALQSSIDEINETDSIDFALITGDITDQGDRATMLRAKGMFDKLKIPYHVVLGNHETTWSESGCMDFRDIFGSESLCFEHNGVKFICFNSGPLLKMAYGHVSPKDIKWATEDIDNKDMDTHVNTEANTNSSVSKTSKVNIQATLTAKKETTCMVASFGKLKLISNQPVSIEYIKASD